MAEKTTTKTKEKVQKKPVAKKTPVREVKSAPKTVPNRSDFAVIESGGKQHLVCVGDVIEIELLGNYKEGDKIEFDKVLMSDDGKSATIGDPYIKGAKVKGSYVTLKKGPKLTIIRFKAKSNRDRRVGHRQKYSTVKIESLA